MLLPLAGVTLHHDAALDDATQDTLDVTPTVADPAADSALPVAALNVNDPAVDPEVQNDLVSDAPNCPPVIRVVVPCFMV